MPTVRSDVSGGVEVTGACSTIVRYGAAHIIFWTGSWA
jgi:hypothetical protein